MSRIGRLPIDVPDKVDVTIDPTDRGESRVTVKGPLGTLSWSFRPEIDIIRDGAVLTVNRKANDRSSRALHGLSRTLLSNMVVGVSRGFEKKLEIKGVGYRAQVQGNKLNLSLGYSHPVEIDIPAGMEVIVEGNTSLTVKGPSKQGVGDLAAKIRAKRPPEPYKGKGVRYATEVVRRKAGKAGKK